MSPLDRRRDHQADDGSVLIIVLVMMVIGAMVIVPLLSYTSTVFKASSVQTEKARSVELARGGTWVALYNEDGLFDMCDGSSLPSSLAGVTTTCEVLEDTTQTPPAEVPYHVAAIQSDVTLPSQLTGGNFYPNPNATTIDPADFDAWLDTPDWTTETELGKVWLPQLPVQATSSGGTRDTDMIPGSQDPLYASCRVFFPGTFSTPITIAEPTYFASGVYYFTEPLTIESGADVVVGNGAAGGCTTDFEAIAAAQAVPDPLNMSGVGGTFVFGGDARLVFDDSAGTDIRFVINRRYVSEDEESVLASAGVSIASVNGTHAPLLPSEALGDDLIADGVIAVPASTVGTDGDPLAANSSYDPSVLTPKPVEPDAPTNVQITPYQENFVSGTDGVDDGMVTVTWDIPNENGALITEYVATESLSGLTCSPPTPTLPDTTVQPSCTIYGLSHMSPSTRTDVTVRAENVVGWSPASAVSNEVRVDLEGTNPHNQSPEVQLPTEPLNAALGAVYSNGIEITWDPPADDGGSAVVGYEVLAIGDDGNVSCEAWWNETSCVLLVGDGLDDDDDYDIWIQAVQWWGDPPAEHTGAAAYLNVDMDNDVTLGGSPAPVQVAAVAQPRMPDPILDIRTTSAADVTILIDGYVAVPQGHVAVGADVPAATKVQIAGGMIAAQVVLEPSVPDTFDVWFNNPVAQKRVRIRSTSSSGYNAVSDAVVQINRSGSIAINSWVVQ